MLPQKFLSTTGKTTDFPDHYIDYNKLKQPYNLETTFVSPFVNRQLVLFFTPSQNGLVQVHIISSYGMAAVRLLLICVECMRNYIVILL